MRFSGGRCVEFALARSSPVSHFRPTRTTSQPFDTGLDLWPVAAAACPSAAAEAQAKSSSCSCCCWQRWREKAARAHARAKKNHARCRRVSVCIRHATLASAFIVARRRLCAAVASRRAAVLLQLLLPPMAPMAGLCQHKQAQA